MIPDETIERVRESADIVGVIGEYVNLKRQGTDFRGPCPFHQGTKRNFSVSPKKLIYYCFVCHETGDVFTFLQKRLGIDWPAAVRMVADKSGIDVNLVRSVPVRHGNLAVTELTSTVNALTVLQSDAPGSFTPLTVTFTFSEAIDQTALTTDDVQFQEGVASEGFNSGIFNADSVTYNAALNQLTAVFNRGRSSLNTLTLVSRATGIHDLAGNLLNGSPNFPLPSGQGNPASDDYVVEFGVGPATPSFTPEINGDYEFQLVVSDDYSSSAPAKVSVHVEGLPAVYGGCSSIGAFGLALLVPLAGLVRRRRR